MSEAIEALIAKREELNRDRIDAEKMLTEIEIQLGVVTGILDELAAKQDHKEPKKLATVTQLELPGTEEKKTPRTRGPSVNDIGDF